jgi:hypothetical protein
LGAGSALLAARELIQCGVEGIAQALFLQRLGFDLVDHHGLGASALVDLAGHDDFVSGKRKKPGILSAGRGGGDGPVDDAVFGEDDELGASIGARSRTWFADRLAQVFRKGTSGIEDLAL